MPLTSGRYEGETTVDDGSDIIDWVLFEKSRAELGPGFIKILSYYREDGAKSIVAIEQAMHEQSTVSLVLPAHTLKGESRMFGAEPLADVAEKIENVARLCVETHRFPDELVPDVVKLRELWDRTIDLFDRATNPLQSRAGSGGFGRKVANQGFGRI